MQNWCAMCRSRDFILRAMGTFWKVSLGFCNISLSAMWIGQGESQDYNPGGGGRLWEVAAGREDRDGLEGS